MKDTENNPNELSGIKEVFIDSLYDVDTDFGRYYTTFNDLVAETGVDKEIHYFRNTINKDVAPKTLEELYAINAKLYEKYGSEEHSWKLLPASRAGYHMNGPDGEFNVKLVLGIDENFEAVYDRKGNLVTEDSGAHGAENMGTYNFFGPSKEDLHKEFDVYTYFTWGNTDELSPGSFNKGVINYNVEYGGNMFIYDFSEASPRWLEVYEKANPESYKKWKEEADKQVEGMNKGLNSL